MQNSESNSYFILLSFIHYFIELWENLLNEIKGLQRDPVGSASDSEAHWGKFVTVNKVELTWLNLIQRKRKKKVCYIFSTHSAYA